MNEIMRKEERTAEKGNGDRAEKERNCQRDVEQERERERERQIEKGRETHGDSQIEL